MLYDPEYPGYLGNNLHPVSLSQSLYREWEHYGRGHVLFYYNEFIVGSWAECLKRCCCLVQPTFNYSILRAVRGTDGVYLGHVAICNDVVISSLHFRIDEKYIK